jgi:hypothetical protein
MPALARDLSQVEVQAFPPWLDLPPGYIVNDWIAWQKGKLVAQRLRQDPSLIQQAIDRLESRRDRLFDADVEWLDLLRHNDVNSIAELLESDDLEWPPFLPVEVIHPVQPPAIHSTGRNGGHS